MNAIALPGTTWKVAICQFEELPIGLGRGFIVGDQSIAVFRTRDGQVMAVENRCPHKGGRLSEGMLAGDQIVCPMHSFRFDAINGGTCDQESVCPVPVYPVEVIDSQVIITISTDRSDA